MVERDESGTLIFRSDPDFRPNLTPREIFERGSFGGTYWKPIRVGPNLLRNQYIEIPSIADLPWQLLDNKNSSGFSEYDKRINKYGVKVGVPYASRTGPSWKSAGWITPTDPYGWVQWYCRYFGGRRIGAEDRRQIGRWKSVKARFLGLHRLHPNSAKIKQVLQHWAVGV